MIRQRGIPKENVLFRILKSKSPTTSNICDKLNHNVKNIILLSEDELCELWQHMKGILLEAEKLYRHASASDKYAKECTLMVKLIHKITVLAIETITQRIFIPNVLLQNIMLLHSVALPNIKDEPVKNEISYLLEMWWKLDMTWKERVIKNALKYLIQNCKCSLRHVKRLYEIRSAITVLKCTEDVQELLKLVQETIVMSLEEGRMLILHLFTLGEQYILGIHNNVRVVLQKVEDNRIALYADLYIAAWFNATKEFKKFIIENCLQNIIFHCFRANRDSTGRGQLGKNLLSLLGAMHDTKCEAARLMIHNECKPLLWKHLKAPGSFIRCNAVEILFMTSFVQYTCAPKDTNKIYLQKFYKVVSDLLNDTDSEVCLITMKGLFGLLGTYWNCIPNDTIQDWLNIFLLHTTNASNSKIRENVFIGIKSILANDRAHKILRDFLPNFAKSIYDDDYCVLKALIKLLLHAHFHVAMPFWDIVPLNYIVDRLETTEDIYLLTELIKLVWIRVSSNSIQYNEIRNEIASIGINNINAVRRLCLHSKPIINWDTSRKLIEVTIPMIKKEMECLALTKKICNKKPRFRDVDDEHNDDCTNVCNEDFDSYRNVQIYIDVIATLLVANEKSITEEQFFEQEVNILQEIAHILPEFLEYFRDTSIYDSILLLFSLIPAKFFLNKIDIIEMLVQELCDTDTPDDTLLTVVYVFMKWNKGDTIFFALTNLFMKSVNMDDQHDKDNIEDIEVTQINEKSLELSLRIWRHLLYVESQSALINKYHSDILKFWKLLHKLKPFLEREVRNECNLDNLICKDTIIQFFKEYMSMIWLLHKEDVFNASKHFSELLLWIKRTMLPHISCLDLNGIEQHSTCLRLTEAALDMSNLQLTEYNSTTKLCCDVVILYCSCLSTASGIIFLDKAFNAILILLDFGKMAYEQDEPNLLSIVIPNLICVTMVILTKYNKDTLIKYANGLKMLCTLTQKYFAVVKNTHEEESLGLQYIRIMLNSALSSISADMTRLLQCPCPTEEQILMIKLPYLAKKVLGVILNMKKYQKLSIQVLLNTITSYTKIDMLSALLVIHKIIKASDKTTINRLKNVTLATKLHNQNQTCDTPFERSVIDAINVVTDAIIHY